MSADLSYIIAGGFVRFLANTTDGVIAWRELAKHSDGSGKFLAHLAPSILAQLRKAGYSVAKEGRAKCDDELLAALTQ